MFLNERACHYIQRVRGQPSEPFSTIINTRCLPVISLRLRRLAYERCMFCSLSNCTLGVCISQGVPSILLPCGLHSRLVNCVGYCMSNKLLSTISSTIEIPSFPLPLRTSSELKGLRV